MTYTGPTDPAVENYRPDLDGYCDYCEKEGHSFSSCPARDDDYPEEE